MDQKIGGRKKTFADECLETVQAMYGDGRRRFPKKDTAELARRLALATGKLSAAACAIAGLGGVEVAMKIIEVVRELEAMPNDT